MNTHPSTVRNDASTAAATALPGGLSASPRRALWLRKLHQWHWISSALCLMAMLLFSITGFTLNHASQIETKPVVTRLKAQLPAALQRQLAGFAGNHADARLPLPAGLADWAERSFPV